MFVTIPLAQQQSIQQTGTTTLNYNFRSVTPRLGKQHLHLAWIEIDVVLDITSAAAASAVGIFDYASYITSLTLQRSPQRPVIAGLPGEALMAMAAMHRQGVIPYIPPAVIAANANAAATRKVRFVIPFDHAFMGTRRYDWCPPVASFIREGLLQIQLNPSPTGSTGLTFTDGSGTVDVNLVCIPLDDPNFAPDVRYEIINTSTTGSLTGQLFPSGIYMGLLYCPWKFSNGGADTITNVTLDGSSYQQSNLFRKYLASRYAERWAQMNVLDNKDADGKNLVVQATGQWAQSAAAGIVPMWWPGPNSDMTKGFFYAPTDYKLDATLSSGSLANGHRWVIARVFARSDAERAQIAAVSGIDPGKVRLEQVTNDSATPAHPARKVVLPERIVSPHSATARNSRHPLAKAA